MSKQLVAVEMIGTCPLMKSFEYYFLNKTNETNEIQMAIMWLIIRFILSFDLDYSIVHQMRKNDIAC